MNLEEELRWLKHQNTKKLLEHVSLPEEWFVAFKSHINDYNETTFYSALVPLNYVPEILKESSWDLNHPVGVPQLYAEGDEEGEQGQYLPFGDSRGIEPLILERTFHGLRTKFFEISQEFRLFHNLYPSKENNELIFFDDNGDPSTAIKLDENLIEIRKDLLFKFCAAKQMALVVFVDSFRFSQKCIEDLSSEEVREEKKGNNYRYDYCLLSYTGSSEKGIKTMSRIVGKKIILPKTFPRQQRTKSKENFQSFIVGNDDEGQEIKHVCGPNLDTPTYLTPIFFRKEVLHKYYSNPEIYKVEDGHLWCGRLWHIATDNDHDNYVAVYLGDLGRDLRETERNYWLSHNISPHGKKISKTEFARSFMGEWCESTSTELVFKRKYIEFKKKFPQCSWMGFFPSFT